MVVPVLISGGIFLAAVAGLMYVVFGMTDWWELLGVIVGIVAIMYFMQNILSLDVKLGM